MKSLRIMWCMVCVAGIASAAAAGTIADARAAGSGAAVTIDSAVISSTTDLISSATSKSFHIQDATGGITVFGSTANVDSLLALAGEGDEVTISATTDEYFGLFELGLGNGPFSMTKIGSPGVPAPKPVGTADFQDGSPAAEGFESMLVRLSNVTFTTTGNFAMGNYTVTDGVRNVSVRVSTGQLDLVGEPIPTYAVDIAGIFTQYDSTDPRTGGYQLLVRRKADIIQTGGNFPPIAQGASLSMNKGAAAVTITLEASDSDGGPFPLTYGIKGGADAPGGAGASAALAFGGTLTDPNNANANVTAGGALAGNQVTFTPGPTASGWFAFTFTASDGADTAEADVNLFIQDTAGLVITEIMYDPANLNTSDDRYESDWEWIEVYNPTASDIYLHTLYDGLLNTAYFYNVFFSVVPAGTTKVIGRNELEFTGEWSPLPAGEVIDCLAKTASGPWFDNGSDILRLFGSETLTGDDARLLDAVAYENGTNGWPQSNNRGSIFLSYDRMTPLDNDVAGNWSLSVAGANGVYQTPETLGPPPDSDEGSPAILPTGPTVVLNPPTAQDGEVFVNQDSAAITISLVATDPDLDPLSFVVEMLVEGLTPTSGSGGTLADPNGGTISTVPYTLASQGSQVRFTPGVGVSGRFAFGFRAFDGSSYSNYAYVTIYIQGTGRVVITEIMHNPGNVNGYDGFDSDWEWIEVHNPSASPVDLHTLWDDGRWSTGNLVGQTIAAGSTLVITRTAGPGRTLTDFVNEWSPLTAGSVIEVNRLDMPFLNNDVDRLFLFAGDGALLDVVAYSTGGSWPVENNKASIFLKYGSLSTFDNDDGANWALSLAGFENAYASASGADVGSPALLAPGTNYPPAALNSRAGVLMNTVKLVALEASDDGLPGGPLSYTIESLPSHSSLVDPGNSTTIISVPYTLVNNGSQVQYTPHGGYTSSVTAGDDQLQFSVNDGAASSMTNGTVTLVVQKGGLIITEIMYNPRNVADVDWEWVEVYNSTAGDITLAILTDDDGEPDARTAVGAIVPAGAVRVVTSADNTSRTTAQFLQEWYKLSAGEVFFRGATADWENLGNSGDRVQLIDNTGALLDDVLYFDTGTWPADDGYASIYLLDGKLDVLENDRGENWALSQIGVDNAYQTPTIAGGGATDDQDVGSPGLKPAAPPVQLLAAKSVKTHAAAGDFVIDLDLAGTAGAGGTATIEPRKGGCTRMVLTFSGSVTADCSAGVTVTNGSCVSVSGSGTAELTVTIGHVSAPANQGYQVDNAKYTTVAVSAPNIQEGTVQVNVGNLFGNAQATDKVISIVDLAAVKGQLFKPVTAVNFRADVNNDGVITIVDLGDIKVNLFKQLP